MDIYNLSDVVEIDDEYWFTSSYLNVLFRMDKSGDNFRIETKLIYNEKKILVNKIILFKDKLILIPAVGDCITIYEKEKKKIIYLSLPEAYVKKGFYHFETAIKYKNKIFMISCLTPIIVVLNLETLQEKNPFYIIELKEFYEIKKKNFMYFQSDHVLIKEHLLIPLVNTEYIADIDCDLMNYKIIRKEGVHIGGIFLYREKLFLIDIDKGSVFLWEKNSIKKYLHSSLLKEREGITFIQSIEYDDKIYIWTDYGDEYISIDMKNNTVSSISMGKCIAPQIFRPGKNERKTCCLKKIDDSLIFIFLGDGTMHRIYKNKDEIICSIFSREMLHIINKIKSWNGLYFKENKNWTIKNFVRDMKQEIN